MRKETETPDLDWRLPGGGLEPPARETVKVWHTDQGLRVDRHFEGRSLRALVWSRDDKFRAFVGEFREQPEGASPGELGWLLVEVRSNTLKTMGAALLWVFHG